MAAWARDEHLDIAFALKKVTISGFRKALKEEDRSAAGSFQSPNNFRGQLAFILAAPQKVALRTRFSRFLL